jgi:hypothetical protein
VIAGDLLHGQMTVVIDDGETPDGAVIEVPRDVSLEQEIVVDEVLHAV